MTEKNAASPQVRPVLITMGSVSDWPQMEHAGKALDALGIPYYVRVTSAHRTPLRMLATMHWARERGFKIVIAGAGGSAHLQGMSSSETPLPVLAVGIKSSSGEYSTIASVYSCIVMPKGVTLPFMGIGEAGAYNAALLAARILALSDAQVAWRMEQYTLLQSEQVPEIPDGLPADNEFPVVWRQPLSPLKLEESGT